MKTTRPRGFFYYVSGRPGTPPAELKYAFPDLPGGVTKQVIVAGGPDGAGGTIFCDHQVAIPPDTASIAWEKMPGMEHHLGIDPAAGAPGPDDLIRDEIIDGYAVKLGDGREWIIPLARVWPEGTRIPSTMALGPDGQLVKKPMARYAPLCRKAERIFDSLAASYGLMAPAGDIEPIDDGREGFDLCCEILVVNYRIGAAEASRLSLIDTGNLKYIFGCLVDWPNIMDAAEKRDQKQKKTADAVAGTSDGGPD